MLNLWLTDKKNILVDDKGNKYTIEDQCYGHNSPYTNLVFNGWYLAFGKDVIFCHLDENNNKLLDDEGYEITISAEFTEHKVHLLPKKPKSKQVKKDKLKLMLIVPPYKSWFNGKLFYQALARNIKDDSNSNTIYLLTWDSSNCLDYTLVQGSWMPMRQHDQLFKETAVIFPISHVELNESEFWNKEIIKSMEERFNKES